jgi:uncharacterized membrane protein
MNLKQFWMEPLLPVWLILLLFLFGLGSVLIQYRLLSRRLNPYRALAISVLRLIAVSLLISLALNPFSIIRKEHRVIPSLAVLVDSSATMNLPGREERTTRLEEAARILLDGQKPLLRSLSEEFDVKLYSLGVSLNPIQSGELSGLKAGGRSADLAEVLGKLDGQNIGVLLLSDGDLQWTGPPSPNLPVLVVPFGDPASYKDNLIKAVKAPPLAFRGREVPIEVTVKSYGYAGITLPVILRDGNRVLGTKSLPISKNPSEATASFSFIPEEIGEHPLSLSVQTQFGESLTANNTVHFPLKVVRDKIRILMISGTPSMNYRFMRSALKDNPSVDLLSFVILRTPTDIINAPIQEQSLIPFPVDTLFGKELKNFDLLIFDDFPPNLYLRPNHLDSVREFVKDGGSFAVIGGPFFSEAARYGSPPLEEILPVRLRKKENYRRGAPTSVKVSRPGLNHPITDFSRNEPLWQHIPPLDGINLLEPKSSATVLLEGADGSQPVLIAGTYGKGRVLTLGTDYAWKWYTGMVAQGKGTDFYPRLVERMVRWLTRDPSFEPVRMTLPEESVEVGEEAGYKINLTQEPLSTDPGPVSVSLWDPDGMRMESEIKKSTQAGEYLGSFIPRKNGVYRIKIETHKGSVEDSLLVGTPSENLDAFPDHERLKGIAASTGGKMLHSADEILKATESYAGKGNHRFVVEKRVPFWENPYLLGGIALLLCGEWYLRRRWGLT